MITPRVATFRQQSLDAIPTISAERAVLMTEAYRLHDGLLSAPMRRALAFRHVMEHRTITIGDGELIVGEKGPAPKATPTYPELCCHTLSDLDILDSREKIPFKVSPETQGDLCRADHPVLAGQDDARAALRRDDRRVAGRVRGGHLHRVHGAARAGPHRAGRQDLPPRACATSRPTSTPAWPSSTMRPTATHTPRARSSRPCASRWTR